MKTMEKPWIIRLAGIPRWSFLIIIIFWLYKNGNWTIFTYSLNISTYVSSGETTSLGPVLRKIFVFWDISILTPDLESAHSILPESR